MQHLFLNRELSQLAKEKEFDEPCLAVHIKDEFTLLSSSNNPELRGKESVKNSLFKWLKDNDKTVGSLYMLQNAVAAPLYQQVIDWFREKNNISIAEDIKTIFSFRFNYSTIAGEYEYLASGETYYEALDKAIEQAFKLIK